MSDWHNFFWFNFNFFMITDNYIYDDIISSHYDAKNIKNKIYLIIILFSRTKKHIILIKKIIESQFYCEIPSILPFIRTKKFTHLSIPFIRYNSKLSIGWHGKKYIEKKKKIHRIVSKSPQTNVVSEVKKRSIDISNVWQLERKKKWRYGSQWSRSIRSIDRPYTCVYTEQWSSYSLEIWVSRANGWTSNRRRRCKCMKLVYRMFHILMVYPYPHGA